MKNLLKFLFVSLMSLLVISCDKDEDQAVLSFKNASTLTSDKTAVVLLKPDEFNHGIKFSWTNANYNAQVSTINILQFAVLGTNFANPKNVNLEAGTNTKSYIVQEFNSLVLNMGLPVTTLSKIQVRIKTTTSVTDTDPKYSIPITIDVTPYALTSYMYAPGAYQGWNPATAQSLLSATSNGIYIGYIRFPAAGSEFKITKEQNLNEIYGSQNNIDLVQNGPNITSLGAGDYKITVNMNTLKIAMDAYSIGVIGSATAGGWGSDTDLNWDHTTQTWKLLNTPLVVGEAKFRLNNDWGVNWGGTGGTLAAGGANISISEPGNYNITFNQAENTYTFVKL